MRSERSLPVANDEAADADEPLLTERSDGREAWWARWPAGGMLAAHQRPNASGESSSSSSDETTSLTAATTATDVARRDEALPDLRLVSFLTKRCEKKGRGTRPSVCRPRRERRQAGKSEDDAP